MPDLRLLALDSEDLEVISAFTQDAVMRVADIGLSKGDSRFALLMNRFVWEASDARGRGERRRTALHFDYVRDVTSNGINLQAKEGVLELLAIRFVGSDNPSGTIVLDFAGGGTIELKVDCLEARLHDLGAAWAAKAKPAHELEQD